MALGDYYPTSIPLSTMKILHALVGYLAVTALPFHLFAFASPLAAIDHDGCVTMTQNYIDSALMKRVPGDIMEARQAAVIVPIAINLVIAIVVDVVVIIDWISDNKKVRGNDVEFLIEHFD